MSRRTKDGIISWLPTDSRIESHFPTNFPGLLPLGHHSPSASATAAELPAPRGLAPPPLPLFSLRAALFPFAHVTPVPPGMGSGGTLSMRRSGSF